jgi:hypothetical protein
MSRNSSPQATLPGAKAPPKALATGERAQYDQMKRLLKQLMRIGAAHGGLRFVFIAQSAYSDRKHWFRMQNMGGSGPLVSAIFKELVAELCGRAVSPRMGAGVAALATVENVEFLLKVLEALEATGILGAQQVQQSMNFLTGCKITAEPGPLPHPLQPSCPASIPHHFAPVAGLDNLAFKMGNDKKAAAAVVKRKAEAEEAARRARTAPRAASCETVEPAPGEDDDGEDEIMSPLRTSGVAAAASADDDMQVSGSCGCGGENICWR